MLIINPATLRHLHETVHRLARGLWFAYSGELVQDGTTIDSDNPGGWLEDAARLLLGGQLDHVTNLEGAEALQALRTIDDAAALKILVTPDGVMGCEAGSLVLVSPPSAVSPPHPLRPRRSRPMARTLTITTDGQVRINDWPGDGQLLDHLYAEIETDLVTTVPLPDGKTMWADDEALFKPDPQINTLGVKLLGTWGELVNYVYGTVVIDGGVTEEGESIPLTDEEAEALRARLAELALQPLPELVAPSWF